MGFFIIDVIALSLSIVRKIVGVVAVVFTAYPKACKKEVDEKGLAFSLCGSMMAPAPDDGICML